jgi:hypothetical protein
MMRLDPQFVAECSKQISKWSKAIRSIYTLEHNLPSNGFPTPDEIEPGRKPYDLALKWYAENLMHSIKLCKQIPIALSLHGDAAKWRQEEHWLVIRAKISTGGKDSINLFLMVRDGTAV